MGRILLVRHGQASFGADDYDALSELGFAQSRLLGASLKERGISVDRVLTGGMRRHRETAETCVDAAGWGLEATVDEGWDEFDFLSILAVHPSPFGDKAPDKHEFQQWFELATNSWVAGEDRSYVETFAAFTSRVDLALERAVALAAEGDVAVFTSGGPIGWAVATVLAGGPQHVEVCADLWKRLNRMSVNTGLSRMITGSRGLNLLSFNDQSHLDASADAITYR